MTDKKRKSKNFGARPYEFYCKYAMRYVIRGCFNRDCKCAHCDMKNACDTCSITYSQKEKQRRITKCTDCRIKTNQIRKRVAAEKQMKKIK